MSEKFDYRELYKEEPIRFRGIQGCGTTDVKPMPKRAPARPRTLRGLDEGLKHCNVPDEHFDQNELERGTEVELEHTDDRSTARCIAKAHLVESPFYYQELEKMERRLKRRKKAFVWRHVGGGCAVGEGAEGSSHPCDDIYENVNTGQEITFRTTSSAHFKMPSMAKSLENIEKRAGVKKG